MAKSKTGVKSKLEKNIQIITGIYTLIYLFIVIANTLAASNNGQLSQADIFSIAFLILFLFGAICCMDYPLITGISFLSWILLKNLVLYNLSNGEPLAFGLSLFTGIPVFFLGVLFIFTWRDKRNQF